MQLSFTKVIKLKFPKEEETGNGKREKTPPQLKMLLLLLFTEVEDEGRRNVYLPTHSTPDLHIHMIILC